ncbi:hypothetical protein V5O48_013351 [Marasmius crinis-equi]|uniref:Glutamine amidotransferase type-2 domain-containing protein n=1 Tax=Marasmius crinis-equi TaxID=585013 RepID=A0ABR3F0C8_9AGAR
MCGISAIKFIGPGANDGVRQDLEKRLRASNERMVHRGPDSSGIFVDEKRLLGLAHTRLSIIDLEGGQQPLHDESGLVHAVVAGELYDYQDLREQLEQQGCQFRSHVDSELVIHLYKIHGLNLVQHLRGEFAFVLYDETRQLLFAARDRFGIKPLYYTLVEGCLMIASEMKALLPLGWKPEWDMESIVNSGEFSDNRTVFKGVFKLPAAHQLTLRRTGQLKVQSYWDQAFPRPEQPETRSIEELIEGVRSRFVDAVRTRLRSDVPLGVYLSGGIDSAVVAGVAAKLLKENDQNAKLTTFTLSFPGRSEHDEGPIAMRMAESIGANVHLVRPTEEDLVGCFERAVYHSEQLALSLTGPGKMLLAEHVRKLGHKVVLTGEGADEMFGGYTFFTGQFIHAIDPAAIPLGIPLPTSEDLDATGKAMEGRRPPQDHYSLGAPPPSTTQSNMGLITVHKAFAASSYGPAFYRPEVIAEVGHPDAPLSVAEGLKAEVRAKMSSGQWHPLNGALYVVANTLLTNGLLNAVGDRAEMAASIEGRPPFLDHHLVEYVNGLPPSVKIKPSLDESEPGVRKWSFTEKWILREAAKPFVTEEIYKNRKSQFNTPLPRPATDPSAQLALTPLQRLLKTRLTEETVKQLGWANWAHIGGILKEYLSGSPDYPADGGLDMRVRILLGILSFVVLQESFGVPTYEPCP